LCQENSDVKLRLFVPASLSVLFVLGALVQVFAAPDAPKQFDPKLFQELRWRLIGPFRGGRTVAAVGVPGQPDVFYMGVNNGGVWKTDDAGRTWRPLFDAQATQSIGALAVAPSDPRVIYAGSGEGLQRPDLSVGDGIYKSTDGGETWEHLGLRDGQQIPALLVDPHDPNRVFAAVLGHPYGPNAEHGVFRSTDGGRSWEKVLYRDENTGAVDLAFDPADPHVLYASLWAARQAPWEIGASTHAHPTFSEILGETSMAVSCREDDLLENALRRSHEIRRVCRLVGGNRKIP